MILVPSKVLLALIGALAFKNCETRDTMQNIRGKHDIFGNLITQKRGLLTLPILVLRAQEHRTITFQELGKSIGVSNHWRMGPIVGYINTTHYDLERRADWDYGDIPCITTIVIKKTGQLSKWIRSQLGPISLEYYRIHHIDPVFEYPHWGEVVDHVIRNLKVCEDSHI